MNHKTTFVSGVILAWVVAFSPGARADAPKGEGTRGSAQERLAKLEVHIDRSKADLKSRRFEVTLSRTASRLKVKVIGESGAIITDFEQSCQGTPAQTPIVVRWNQENTEAIARIEVIGYDVYGYYAGIALIPWSVTIPHEELQFKTNSAAIESSEIPKLEASFEKISEVISKHASIGNIMLFIAGHTDTVGSESHNVQLSLRRAQAIAQWFRNKGLRLPILYEGFGEHALAVATKDETSEARNRRVDYILALDAPAIKSGAYRPNWRTTK